MIRAHCFASGHIGFGNRIPAGVTIIARGPEHVLREFIGANAYRERAHGRNPSLLVPGVAAADNSIIAAGALDRWRAWIATKAPADVRVLPVDNHFAGVAQSVRAPDASHQEVESSNPSPRSTLDRAVSQ